MSELQQQIEDLKVELKVLKENQENPTSVYFSVATAKRVHCYNCAINFELVKIFFNKSSINNSFQTLIVLEYRLN
jgi:hypothetical protein